MCEPFFSGKRSLFRAEASEGKAAAKNEKSIYYTKKTEFFHPAT